MIRLVGEGRYPIVASRYGENAGVPALFGSDYFDHLGSLEDDTGARKLLREMEANIHLMDPGQGIWDIDSPEDYERLSGKTLE